MAVLETCGEPEGKTMPMDEKREKKYYTAERAGV